MRIDEGKLRAYLDQALPPEEQEQVRKQLADSPQAQAWLARLSQERDGFAQYLAALAPGAGDRSAAPQALRRLKAHIRGQSPQTSTTEKRERTKLMGIRPFIRRYQSVIAVLAVVALTAGLFSLAPVRAMAGNFLKVFRVQTVKIVPVDADHLRAMRDDPRFQGLLDELEPQIEVVVDSEAQTVDSLAEANGLADFPVAEITALAGELGEPSSITVFPEKVVNLNLDRELLEAIFAAADIEISLPDSLNEEPFVVTEPNSVVQTWEAGDREILSFVQMTAPEIEYPDDLDLEALGVAGLQLLGMSEAEATALGASIDWTTTLVLPFPTDAEKSVTEVSVNGADGFLFADPDAEDAGAAVMWQENDMSYLVTGEFSADQVMEMAESVTK
jgi:anti-sigma factor RsiW